MKLRDTIRRSGRNLRSAKIRTLLTALAIAVGAFTLTLTLAAGNGVREYTSKLVKNNFDPAELIVGRDKEVSNNGAPLSEPKEYDESVSSLQFGGGGSGGVQVKRVTRADVEELENLPYVEEIRENYQINVRYVTRERQKRFTAAGEVYNPAQKPETAAGQLPESGDIAEGEVLLPDSYLGALGFENAEAAIGQEIQLTVQRPFSPEAAEAALQSVQTGATPDEAALQPQQQTVTLEIAAVTKRAATSIAVGIQPLLLNSEDARELYRFTTEGTPDYQKYLFVYARIKDGANDEKLAAAQTDLESKGYHVQSSQDLQKTITQFVNILQIMVGVFGLITVIASIFGIVNTQYISVLERTREIGLMKALGMSRGGVSRLFMIEATWIGFLGGLLGILAGLALGTAANPLISKSLELGTGNQLLIFQPLQLVLLLAALMLVATVAGLLPARKAAKLDPIEALRTE